MPGRSGRLSRDFWVFWSGQAISTLGTSFTNLALPLLVYRITGSAVNLALTSAATFLPYPLFGLVIGAWVDRTDRKRLMVITNVLQALVVGSIPALAAGGHLAMWWIYAMGFAGSTMGIFFSSAEFAVVPSLVRPDDLVTANGRIQASYSTVQIAGPVLAGMLAALMPIERVMYFDAASFLIAAGSLLLIRTHFNLADRERSQSLLRDVGDGLRYVLSHPVLRNISLMMAIVNFFSSTVGAQLVLYGKQHLHAGNAQIGLLYSVESIGIVVLSLTAGPLRKRFSFSRVALTALMLSGVFVVAMSVLAWYPLALVCLGLQSGLGILFNINTGSLRQAIVPNHMLGRVLSIAGVLAWSAIPVGTFLGGLAIQVTGNVALVYGVIGATTILIPFAFSFTALGHADRYLPGAQVAQSEATS